jgi:hypothetical protein
MQVPQEPPHPSGPHWRSTQSGLQTSTTRHWSATHDWPAGQVPHWPPHPLSPQALPPQLGVQMLAMQTPSAQACPFGQAPQVPPQPSSPQFRSPQSGEQDPLFVHEP